MAIYTVSSGNGGGVNVRASKNTSSTKLGNIADGTRVDIVRCDASWSTLVYNGTPAFVMHQYLSDKPSTYGAGLTSGDSAVCNGSSVNVRNDAEGATTGRRLSKGEQVTVREYSDMYNTDGIMYRWYRIGTDEWVRGDYLAPGTSSGTSGGGNVSDITTVTTFSAQVLGENVRIRDYPSTSGNAIGWPNINKVITCSTFTGIGNNDQRHAWLWCNYPSSGGFIYARYVYGYTHSYDANAARITGTNVNLRVLPSTSAEIIGRVGLTDYDDPIVNNVRIIDNNTYSDWTRVVTTIGTGWISSQYVDPY